MPTSEQHARFLDEEKRPPSEFGKLLFRQELRSVRRMVIDYSLEYPGDFHVMKSAVKIATAIDALDKAMADLASYIRHEDTRADDREREAEEKQRERDRRQEIDHARNGY